MIAALLRFFRGTPQTCPSPGCHREHVGHGPLCPSCARRYTAPEECGRSGWYVTVRGLTFVRERADAPVLPFALTPAGWVLVGGGV